MKRLLFIYLCLCACNLIINGQDIIIKRDGISIMSKVIEVSPEYIKYKKYSNLDGPTYTIYVKDVHYINYQNGDKDVFNNDDERMLQITSLSSKNDLKLNEDIISNYNERDVAFTLNDSKKKPKWMLRMLKIHKQSKMANSDCKLGVYVDSNSDGASVYVSFENTSDKTIYLDLGSSTFRRYTTASSFYTNTSTTITKGKEGGGSVNLGPIADVVGIGGIVGTLASGVNVSGGLTSEKSTTVYADRVITIAPHTKYNLPSQEIYNYKLHPLLNRNYSLGERMLCTTPELLKESPWEIIVSYYMDGNMDASNKMDVGLYISEEIPVLSKSGNLKNNLGIYPLHYYYGIRK